MIFRIILKTFLGILKFVCCHWSGLFQAVKYIIYIIITIIKFVVVIIIIFIISFVCMYDAYSRPNGLTDCAEICCGHSGVAGGCYRLKEFEIFLSTFFFNFFFHGNRRALQQVKYETIAKKFADFIYFFVNFLNYTKIKWRQIFEIPSIHLWGILMYVESCIISLAEFV